MVARVGPTPMSGGDGPQEAHYWWEGPHEFSKSEMKRSQRYWWGMVALCEIHQYQSSTKLLINKWPFACLVCEKAQEQGAYNLCFQVLAIQALQEATEYYMICLLEDSNLYIIHAKIVMIMLKIPIWHTVSVDSRPSKVCFFFFCVVVGCSWSMVLWVGEIVK